MTAYLSGAADYWALIQSVIAVLLVALSLVLAYIAAKTLIAQHKNKTNGEKENAA
jgi:carbon starvation protein